MQVKTRSFVLFIGVLLFFLSSASVYASPRTTPSSSNYQEKIFWVDQYGHITKSWHGNQVEAEKIRVHERAKIQALRTASGLKSPVTPYINRNDNCYYNQNHTDFEAFSETITCWQDSGTDWDAYTRDVYEIQTGSQSGWFAAVYQNNAFETSDPYFGPHETYFPEYGGGTGPWILYTVNLN